MGSLRRILALAAFEARLNLRLIRGWVLGALVTLVGLAGVAYYVAIHRWASGFSASWAFITKDLWVLQPTIFLGLLLGIVGIFYSFDWRHRDQSIHFAPTLDASPLSRLEHAWGKFLGLTVLVAWPMLVMLVVTVVLSVALGIRLPPSVFAMSVLGYGVPFALAPLALSFGVAGLVRNQALARVAAIVLPVAWIGVIFGAGFALPERLAVLAGAIVDLPFHSDLVGYVAGPVTILQRVASVLEIALFASLAAFGPLGLPRDPSERRRRIGLVGGMALALAATLAGIYASYARTDAARREVLAAEQRAFEKGPGTVVVRRDIEVDLAPGRRLAGRARLRLRRIAPAWPTEIPLRLNAGMTLRSASLGGAPATWTRDATVVTLAVPAATTADEVDLDLAWDGRPTWPSVDAGRALADLELDAPSRNNRRFFGVVPLYFERGCVLLGTDAGWYPDTSMLLGARFPALARQDLAPGSLVVKLPAGLRVASVGRREEQAGRVTFTSDVPVPGFALVAGPYEEGVAEVDGIRFRVLYHPAHRRNVELFASAKDALLAHIHERLEEVRTRTGLSYPHPELTLVDVPQQLDVHSSGWDGANRMAAPGLVLAREGQLFRARFEQAVEAKKRKFRQESGSAGASAPSGTSAGSTAPSSSSASSGAAAATPAAARTFDTATAVVDVVESFCGTDFTGGDPERLALASFWDHRVRPAGRGSALLAMAVPAFVAEVALGRYVPDTPEVARVLNGPAIGESVQAIIQGKGDEVGDIIMSGIADRDLVWALMQEKTFDEMDPTGKPAEFAGALYVRGRQPLLAVRDALGAERTATALASLVADPSRSDLTFERLRDAFVAASDPEHAQAVAQQLDGLLSGTALPGYVVKPPRAWRLPGATEAWQAMFVVENRGTADGTARLRIGEGTDAISREVRVPAGGGTEVGIVVPRQPGAWTLVPYLALNRRSPAGSFDIVEDAAAEPPFDGVRAAIPDAKPEIIVDNVDPGFSVVVEGQPTAWGAKDADGERALGIISILWFAPSKWKRWQPGESASTRPFGCFVETAAVKKGAEGTSPATWIVTLPERGSWRVATFLPPKTIREGGKLAPTYSFVVKSSAGEKEVELALDAGTRGWNDLGSFDFDGPAEVRLLDRGKGLIVADAVRFTKE